MAKVESPEYYLDLFTSMITERSEVDDDFEQYDKMYHFNWELPPGFKKLEWISQYVSPVAHDTVNVTVKTLGVNEPNLHFFPPNSDERSRQFANNVEETLAWNLYLASKRKRGNMYADIVRNACMYHAVCGQVVDIKQQIKSIEASGRSAAAYESMLQFSPFLINLYSPRVVYWRYSNIMLESVLLAQVKTAYEIYKEYGDGASKLREDAESKGLQTRYNLYDFMDDTVHTVLATPYQVGEGTDVNSIYRIIEPQEHGLKFMPWVISCGGSDTEIDQRDQFHGILYPLLRGKLWEFLNRAESLIHSRSIALAGRPEFAEVSQTNPMNNRLTTIDRTSPEGVVQVTPGSELQPLPATTTSPAMQEAEVRIKTDITATTGTAPMQLVGVPEGTAYSTLTLLLQNAAGNIEPYKDVAENFIEGVCRCLLLCSHYNKTPLDGYSKNWKNTDNYGRSFSIDPSLIDPQRIYLKAELVQNLPIDQLQRVNSATMAVQTLNLSQEDAMEMCGIRDPLRSMNRRRIEILKDAKLQDYIARMQMAREIEQQQAVVSMQQQALEAQQNMQGMGNPQVSGQGFNPATGGTPPAQANPNVTREMQRGFAGEGVA